MDCDVALRYLLFYRYGDHRDLHVLTHSFPTRRSSDLMGREIGTVAEVAAGAEKEPLHADQAARSEEHTSELQSLMRTSYAVFCLKNKTPPDTITHSSLLPKPARRYCIDHHYFN